MLNVKLLSASELYLEQKSFVWKIMSHDENEINLLFEYNCPTCISVDGVDILVIEFFNTNQFIKPQDDSFKSVPDGYSLKVKIPP